MEEFDVAKSSYGGDLPPCGGAVLAAAQMSAWSLKSPMTIKSSEQQFRDILRKVMVSEQTLKYAVARLGGGAQGLQVLMGHVNFWASSASHEHDVTATIRKGILDLGMPPQPKRHGYFEAHWKNNARLGICEGTNHEAAYTRALRKSHMVRQRGHSKRAQRDQSNRTSKCGHQSRHLRSSTNHQWFRDLDPELGNGNGKGYAFLFQKELRASDVSSLGRIVLPKKDSERHLPFLIVREGVMIALEDYHSGFLWTVRYRFWPNNKSRMYLLENIGGFVTLHRLQEGDLMLFYRNALGGYVIRSQKVPRSAKVPARGLSSYDTQGLETIQTAEMRNLINTSEESTTDMMSDSSDLANSSIDSELECTLRDASGKAFDAGPSSIQQSCVAQQLGCPINYDEGVLRTGYQASCKPPVLEDPSYDSSQITMLSVNVKQRYMDSFGF